MEAATALGGNERGALFVTHRRSQRSEFPAVPGWGRERDVLARVPFGRSFFWDLIRDGFAPKPQRLGPRMNAWSSEVCMDFIARLPEILADYHDWKLQQSGRHNGRTELVVPPYSDSAAKVAA